MLNNTINTNLNNLTTSDLTTSDLTTSDLTTSDLTTSDLTLNDINLVLDTMELFNIIPTDYNRYLLTELALADYNSIKFEILDIFKSLITEINQGVEVNKDKFNEILDNCYSTEILEIIDMADNGQIILHDSMEDLITDYIGSIQFDIMEDLRYFIDNDVIKAMYNCFKWNCSCSGEADFIEISGGQIIQICY